MVYRVGFRDDFNPSIKEIMRMICDLEARADPENAKRSVPEIQDASNNTTHMSVFLICLIKTTGSFSEICDLSLFSIPNYVAVSKPIDAGWATPVIRYIRVFLIEEIYQRLGAFGIFQLVVTETYVMEGLLLVILATMFPETANWTVKTEEYVFFPSYCQCGRSH